MSKKRQDHVFNHDLQKTLEELERLVQELLDIELQGKDIHGVALRSNKLRAALGVLRQGLTDENHAASFNLVVDKGATAEEGDVNSRLYGNAKQQLVFAFRQFLQSQKRWELAGHRDMDSASRFLHTSCLHVRLALVHGIETAVDADTENLANKDRRPHSRRDAIT
jgi:hypothetical protein